MLDEGDLAMALRRDVHDAPERVAGLLEPVVPPVFRRERWISNDEVESPQAARSDEFRLLQRVAALNSRGAGRSVQQHVHAGDGPGLGVYLLTKDRKPSGLVPVQATGLIEHLKQ